MSHLWPRLSHLHHCGWWKAPKQVGKPLACKIFTLRNFDRFIFQTIMPFTSEQNSCKTPARLHHVLRDIQRSLLLFNSNHKSFTFVCTLIGQLRTLCAHVCFKTRRNLKHFIQTAQLQSFLAVIYLSFWRLNSLQPCFKDSVAYDVWLR